MKFELFGENRDTVIVLDGRVKHVVGHFGLSELPRSVHQENALIFMAAANLVAAAKARQRLTALKKEGGSHEDLEREVEALEEEVFKKAGLSLP